MDDGTYANRSEAILDVMANTDTTYKVACTVVDAFFAYNLTNAEALANSFDEEGKRQYERMHQRRNHNLTVEIPNTLDSLNPRYSYDGTYDGKRGVRILEKDTTIMTIYPEV